MRIIRAINKVDESWCHITGREVMLGLHKSSALRAISTSLQPYPNLQINLKAPVGRMLGVGVTPQIKKVIHYIGGVVKKWEGITLDMTLILTRTRT